MKIFKEISVVTLTWPAGAARITSLLRDDFADDAMAGMRLPEFADMKPVCTKLHPAHMKTRVHRLPAFKAAQRDVRAEIHAHQG